MGLLKFSGVISAFYWSWSSKLICYFVRHILNFFFFFLVWKHQFRFWVSIAVSYQLSPYIPTPPISYLTIDTRNHQILTLTPKTKMGLSPSPSPRLDIIGFRVYPNDHELLSYFLYSKVTGKSLDLYHGFIPNFDL